MSTFELRDPLETRRFLTQGLWLQRAVPVASAHVRPALEWALEAASTGQPLPPIGFVADLGRAAFSVERTASNGSDVAIPGIPGGLLRTYEDQVLGKFYADWTFARACDALRRYTGRNQARALAFLLNQFRERSGFPGVELGPAVLKGLLDEPPEAVLAEGWQLLNREGLAPLLLQLYHGLIEAARRTAEVLALEDVAELEDGTALDETGQRLALRQVRVAAARLGESLPRTRPRIVSRRHEVATQLRDEDTYPVGGYSSLATHGSIESLLHSQLAYMEKEERPDLFDLKYLRDELLYYARDENQFLRRRRTFVLVLFPDLVEARFKDPGLPWQRGVLLLGLLLAAVGRLIDWLSDEALTFVFLFVSDTPETPLATEWRALETLLREEIDNGTVELQRVPADEAAAAELVRRSKRSHAEGLTVATVDRPLSVNGTVLPRLVVNGPRPALITEEQGTRASGEDPVEAWGAVLAQLLERWL